MSYPGVIQLTSYLTVILAEQCNYLLKTQPQNLQESISENWRCYPIGNGTCSELVANRQCCFCYNQYSSNEGGEVGVSLLNIISNSPLKNGMVLLV